MASNNIARLGVVLGLDTAEFSASIDKAISENKKLAREIQRDTNSSVGMLAELKYATEDYGKTLTKVAIIEREIAGGRLKFATDEMKTKLLQQAAAYDKVAASATAAQKASKAQGGMNEWQKQGLMYQTTDFVTQIASGQNVLIAAIQQGGQLKDQMGGIVPMFRMLGGILFTTTGAVVAMAAGFGVLAIGMYQGREEVDKLNKTILLTGNYAQMSANDFQGMARVISSSSSSSIGQVKDILSAMISSGQFTKQTFNSVATVIEKYAELADLTGKQAAEKLIPSLDGSASSALKLNNQFHFLTLEQYKHIEALNTQGKKQEAITETTDLLNESFNRQKRELGYLDTALQATTKFFSDFWDAVKGMGKAEAAEEKIIRLQTTINSLREKGAPKSRFPGDLNPENFNKELARLEAEKKQLTDQLVAEKNRSDKTIEESDKITAYTEAGGADKASQIRKQIADADRAARLANAMNTNNVLIKLDKDLAFAKEKIDADYQENIKGKGAVFQKEYEQLKNTQTIQVINEFNLKLKDLLKQQTSLYQDAAKAERVAKYTELMSWQDEEHKIIEEGTFNLIEIRAKYNQDIADKDSAFVAARTAVFKAETDKEISSRDAKLNAYYDKTRIKNIDAAIKEREDRQKIADEEIKVTYERVQKDVDFYAKAKEASDIEKAKLETQINMVGFSEKKVKIAEAELQYQREIRDLEKSGLYNEATLAKMKQDAKDKRDATVNIIQLGDKLKELKAINDVVWQSMSDAIDNFVDKGISSFEDFTKRILQELLKIELKKQALAMFNMAGNAGGIFSTITSFLGFADGGNPPVNQPSMVGERGPELFVPKTAGTIIPNNQLAAMGSGQTINYNGPYIASMNAIDTQSGVQFLAKNKQAVWATYQSANRSIPMSR